MTSAKSTAVPCSMADKIEAERRLFLPPQARGDQGVALGEQLVDRRYRCIERQSVVKGANKRYQLPQAVTFWFCLCQSARPSLKKRVCVVDGMVPILREAVWLGVNCDFVCSVAALGFGKLGVQPFRQRDPAFLSDGNGTQDHFLAVHALHPGAEPLA
jgi:hypothetical protein